MKIESKSRSETISLHFFLIYYQMKKKKAWRVVFRTISELDFKKVMLLLVKSKANAKLFYFFFSFGWSDKTLSN
jgi:hypothetical protein